MTKRGKRHKQVVDRQKELFASWIEWNNLQNKPVQGARDRTIGQAVVDDSGTKAEAAKRRESN